MNAGNTCTSNIFILLGFSYHPWSEMPLFIVVLAASIYNQWVPRVDPYLDNPLYFFFSSLSFLHDHRPAAAADPLAPT